MNENKVNKANNKETCKNPLNDEALAIKLESQLGKDTTCFVVFQKSSSP